MKTDCRRFSLHHEAQARGGRGSESRRRWREHLARCKSCQAHEEIERTLRDVFGDSVELPPAPTPAASGLLISPEAAAERQGGRTDRRSAARAGGSRDRPIKGALTVSGLAGGVALAWLAGLSDGLDTALAVGIACATPVALCWRWCVEALRAYSPF